MTEKSFESWIGSIFYGISQGFAVFALVESGCLNFLKSHSPKEFSAEHLATELKLNPRILLGILNTVALSDSGIVSLSSANQFGFGPNGDWALKDGCRGLGQIVMGGYSEVLSNLLELLKDNKVYNTHLTRKTAWVGEGTYTFTKIIAPYVIAEIKKTPNPSVLDLGCGTGRLLLKYTEEFPVVKCAGVEISESSVTLAKQLAATAGYSQPEYFIGDVFHLEAVPDLKSRNINILTANFIFHEFLYEKNNRLHLLLKSLKRNFPGARLICTEFNALSPTDYMAIKPEKRMPMLTYHHLIHSITDQGMPMTVDRWSEYFVQNEIIVEKVKTLSDRQISIYYLRL
jgi:ubiquinone/menaquinone biosynthesis C-methylase UbiE